MNKYKFWIINLKRVLLQIEQAKKYKIVSKEDYKIVYTKEMFVQLVDSTRKQRLKHEN